MSKLIGFKTGGHAARLGRKLLSGWNGEMTFLKDASIVVIDRDGWLYGAQGTEMLWSEAKRKGLLK